MSNRRALMGAQRGGSPMTGYYNIASGDFAALFHQYAVENNMVEIDVSFASDVTANYTITHNLGRVPVEALLYPKNPTSESGYYQLGWTVNSNFARDNNANRTYKIWAGISDVWYPDAKNLISILNNVTNAGYNFTQSVPTDTEITIRGGTNQWTKLKAGDYVLALK